MRTSHLARGWAPSWRVVCVGILAVVIQMRRNGKSSRAFRGTHSIAEPCFTSWLIYGFARLFTYGRAVGGNQNRRLLPRSGGLLPLWGALWGPFSLEWLFDPRTRCEVA